MINIEEKYEIAVLLGPNILGDSYKGNNECILKSSYKKACF